MKKKIPSSVRSVILATWYFSGTYAVVLLFTVYCVLCCTTVAVKKKKQLASHPLSNTTTQGYQGGSHTKLLTRYFVRYFCLIAATPAGFLNQYVVHYFRLIAAISEGSEGWCRDYYLYSYRNTVVFIL